MQLYLSIPQWNRSSPHIRYRTFWFLDDLFGTHGYLLFSPNFINPIYLYAIVTHWSLLSVNDYKNDTYNSITLKRVRYFFASRFHDLFPFLKNWKINRRPSVFTSDKIYPRDEFRRIFHAEKRTARLVWWGKRSPQQTIACGLVSTAWPPEWKWRIEPRAISIRNFYSPFCRIVPNIPVHSHNIFLLETSNRLHWIQRFL